MAILGSVGHSWEAIGHCWGDWVGDKVLLLMGNGGKWGVSVLPPMCPHFP